MPSDQTMNDCHICTSLKEVTTDGLIFQDPLWCGTTVADVPGWIMVQTNRHAEWFWELTPDEAAALGPIVARLSRLIREVCDADKVYVMGLGENAIHPHLLFIARRPDDPPEVRGPNVVSQSAALANTEEARRIASALRQLLDQGQ